MKFGADLFVLLYLVRRAFVAKYINIPYALANPFGATMLSGGKLLDWSRLSRVIGTF